MKRKLLSFVLAICLILPCVFALTACGNNDDPSQARVMNVELNPQLEFVLDTDNKVVSVNALNDEGNKIILSATFVGLSAEDAVDKFLEIAKEDGYLITGSVNAEENQINISISGDSKNLLKAVKDSAVNYLNSVNINADVLSEAIAKSELVAKVEECMREYEQSELNNLTEEQLIELIKQSRNETKDLHTQELKELYYSMRESAIIKAEFAKIEELVNALPESFANIKTTVLEFITQLEGYMANIEEELQAYFTEGGAYKVAMQNFITEKQILLEARLAGTATKLQESVVSAKESALKLAKSAINDAVALVKTTMNTVLTQIETTLGTYYNKSIDY